MTVAWLKLIQKICVIVGFLIVMTFNLVNYFYVHKVLNDIYLQWKIAGIGMASVMLLGFVHAWISWRIRRNKLMSILSGWVALYLLINLVGVVLGYSLHSRAFMMILFLTTAGAVVNVIIRLWSRS